MRAIEKIAFLSSPTDEARGARARLVRRYGNTSPDKADVIVALGGDGLMLRTLHTYLQSGIPIYGMNRGSVGFLMNEFSEDHLIDRLSRAEVTAIKPLLTETQDSNGNRDSAFALNEVALLRQTHQTAKLSVRIDERERLAELTCDGLMVATPAGSTAYNLSAHGPILPITAPLLALTPISPFRPRYWRGALLPDHAKIEISILDPEHRPVSATADHTEFRNIIHVKISSHATINCHIMFDAHHSWEERILNEQFRF